jgi:hypothetical protein
VPVLSALRSQWSALLALLLILVTAVAAHGVEFGDTSVPSEVLATDVAGQASADQHEQGTAAVAYVHRAGAGKALSVRFRVGATWGDPVTVAAGARVFSPQVTMITPARALVIWTDATPGGGYDTTLRAAVIAVAGETLVPARILGPLGTATPQVVTRGDGTALVTWPQSRPPPGGGGEPSFDLYAARLNDLTVSAASLVAAHSSADFRTFITRDGTALVAFRSAADREMRVLESSSAPVWRQASVRPQGSSRPAFAEDADGSVVMMWAGGGDAASLSSHEKVAVLAARRTEDGRWSEPQALAAPGVVIHTSPALVRAGDTIVGSWPYSAAGYIDADGRTVLAELRGGRLAGHTLLPGGDPTTSFPSAAATGGVVSDGQGVWVTWGGDGIRTSHCDGLRCTEQRKIVSRGSRERVALVATFAHGPIPSVLWLTGDQKGDLVEGRLAPAGG